MSMDEVLSGDQPILLMLSHGETLSSDLTKALEKAKKDGLEVVRVNVDEEPEYGKQFDIGKHPVLIAWHCGEVLSRRSRPWGTDADQIISSVKPLVKAATPAKMGAKEAKPTKEEKTIMDAKEKESKDKAVVPQAHPDHPVEVTDQTFMELVINSSLPVIIDFWAEWCGPCRMVAPIFDKLAKEYQGKVMIAKVDVDANPMLSQQFQIQSIPTMMFVKEGKIVGKSVGAAPEGALRDVIKQLIDLQIPADAK
jgi:thioredoxin 1